MSFSENIRKFVTNTNQALNRAVQLTGEVIGSNPKTAYDEEIVKSLEIADKIYKCCDKIQSGITAWLTTNPIDRMQEKMMERFETKITQKATSSELLGQLNLSLSEMLAGSELSIALAQYGSALLDLGQFEREMSHDINKNLLAISRYYLDVIWPEVQNQRRALETCRLDFDSVLLRHARCTEVSKQRTMEAELKEKKQLFDKQSSIMKTVLNEAGNIQNQLKNGLKEMAASQTRYHTACLQQMRQLVERLENPNA